ncbi:NUDIX hydrolase [Ruminiclostridium cellobioparum]|uniref:ADP-ribose pyrophosphatase n=1 Tax=Ruminiclostridium cellobioparum subsp. termitidis CT1112 TaxID=1195236 RepID=S0FNP5_RUMCE|nr:NUDIX hydrolase [Ruminiclostridium cellobioparum]EMS70103.1 ADP-ribose pyrophosphatase [Ruminiclostridium cellobioparum subsp. termitidis CT1112]
MLVRNCAGGVVFSGEKVFLLKNEKDEWVLPKGVIKIGEYPDEVARRRVKEEAGINAEIISTAGNTNYEFFSVTRQRPVCNKITWYVMKSLDDKFEVNKEENFTDGGYFTIEEALQKITYSQDRSLINCSYSKYCKVENSDAVGFY